MILIDTPVWIDHLRAAESVLVDALARDDVACHPLVIQELALGSTRKREAVLQLLGRLIQCPSLSRGELLTLVSVHVLWGEGLSPVDAHPLGSVLLSPGTRLWTRDKSPKASAGAIGAATVDWHWTTSTSGPRRGAALCPVASSAATPPAVGEAECQCWQPHVSHSARRPPAPRPGRLCTVAVPLPPGPRWCLPADRGYGAAVLADGWVAVVKRDCPTCVLVVPVLQQLAAAGRLTVVSQDDPSFPDGVDAVDDRELETSWRLQVETVPTLLRVEDGVEVARTVGWLRADWEALTGVPALGPGLPEHRPGCGSRSVEWGVEQELERRYGGRVIASRTVELADLEDEVEAAYARGWTDGLPVVPPTEERVLAMLAGTSRAPSEVVAVVPPDLAPCTVEKVAVNAVMAGCLPEHLPVVLAAVTAACTDAFNVHGVLATTWSASPLVVVNGPVARAVGLNSGGNALGQGTRANATIGRALQLVVRNVGGGRPGEVDRATQGQPGKYTACFAEAEQGSPFEPLAASRGVDGSAATLFAGSGWWPVCDQLSRTPESLARTFAAALRGVWHPKLVLGFDAMLVVGPEHGRVLREAGWDRARLLAELEALLTLPGEELVRGAGGMAEGMAADLVTPAGVSRPVPKFRPGGLLLVHAGGAAGLFSTVVPGWVGGPGGSEPVTVPIDTTRIDTAQEE